MIVYATEFAASVFCLLCGRGNNLRSFSSGIEQRMTLPGPFKVVLKRL